MHLAPLIGTNATQILKFSCYFLLRAYSTKYVSRGQVLLSQADVLDSVARVYNNLLFPSCFAETDASSSRSATSKFVLELSYY